MEYLLYICYLLIFAFIPGYIVGKKKTHKGIIITAVLIGIIFYIVAAIGNGINEIDVPGPDSSTLPISIGILGGVLSYLGGRVGRAVSKNSK